MDSAVLAASVVTPPDPPPPTYDLVDAREADTLAETFSVNTHLTFLTSGYQNWQAVVDLVTALGARCIRERWGTGSPPGQISAMQDLAAVGIRTHATLGAFYTNTPTAAQIITNLKAAFGAARGGIFRSFGGVNEPNDNKGTPKPPDWAVWTRNWQRDLFQAVRADPGLASALVVAPALKDSEPTLQADFTALGALNIAAWVDCGDIHVYPGGQVPSNKIDQRKAWARVAYPEPAPFYVTEGGYANIAAPSNPTPVDVAMVYDPRLLMEHYWRGHLMFNRYELLDDPDGAGTNPQSHWGLVYTPTLNPSTWTKKPSFYAMQRLMGLVADPGPAHNPGGLRFSTTPPSADYRQSLVAKRNGKFYLLMWRDTKIWDTGSRARLTPAAVTHTVSMETSHTVRLFRPSLGADAATPTALSAWLTTPTSTVTGTSFTVPLAGDLWVAEIT